MLKRTGKVAIATIVIRTRQQLCAVMVRGDVLVLVTLRYAPELVDERELGVPKTDLKKLAVTPTELDIANRLVASMTGKFAPDRYRDTYRDELLQFVRTKAKRGESDVLDESEPHVATIAPAGGDRPDTAAEASLASIGRGGGATRRPRAAAGDNQHGRRPDRRCARGSRISLSRSSEIDRAMKRFDPAVSWPGSLPD